MIALGRVLVLGETERALCALLGQGLQVKKADIAVALGVSVYKADALMRKLAVSGSEETKRLLALWKEEAKRRWWATKPRTDPEAVLNEIRRLSGDLGRAPSMREAGHVLVCRAIRYFGSWNNALSRAGVGFRKLTLPRSPEERRRFLIEAVRHRPHA